MAHSEQNSNGIGRIGVWTTIVALAISVWLIAAGGDVQAQTFSVLHTLSASEGRGLLNGLVADRAGNLYGTGSWGGLNNCPSSDPGCGTVFKLSQHDGHWLFSVIYQFTGAADGWWPLTIAVGPDGSLYGTTIFGGLNECFMDWGCGIIFRLQPPPSFCPSVSCPWVKTTLFEFGPTLDGTAPSQTLTFDQAGNIYGTTGRGGTQQGGTVWELVHSNGNWTFNVLYNNQDVTGETALGVAFDAAGNLWDAGYGGDDLHCGGYNDSYWCGVIWELTPSGSGWQQNFPYSFSHTTGGSPSSNFIFDHAGNLYGTVADNGPAGNGGVFQYSPSSGQYNLIYAAPGNVNSAYGPQGTPAMDEAGNVYAADPSNGANDFGYVFKLTSTDGNWIYTDLHDFTGGSDGAAPYGPLVVDGNGNVYGATSDGIIFEITP